MTDNSAEREVERILKEALEGIQAERCPQGEECSIHHRVDEEYFKEDIEYARLITYSGDYAVVTEDNPVLEHPAFILKLVLGGVKKVDFPPRWETSIFYVGSGTLGDLAQLPQKEQLDALRYAETHDEWEHVRGVHDTVVSALQSGLIDVSKPLNLED